MPGEQYQYAYDGLGNRTNSAAGGDSSGQNLRSTGYAVNNLNQYTSVTNSGYVEIIGSASGPASVAVNTLAAYERGEFFHKELAGNTTTNPMALSVSAIANISGTTATNSISLLLPPQNQALTNDLDGNLTSDGLWVYVWDAENRLTSMYSATNVPTASRRLLEFGYDYEGKRISKKVSTWVSGNWSQQSHTVFLYDGWRPLVEMDGTTVANLVPTLLLTYTWGQDLSRSLDDAGGIGGLVAYQEIQGANTWTHFPIYDGNGNVTGLYSGAGERTAKYEYSPFGEVITKFEAPSVKYPFRFSTKHQDLETGLVYYGYRYFAASLGRWINRDPKAVEGGINLLAFLKNGSLNQFDPFGLTAGSMGDTGAAMSIDEGGVGEGASTASKAKNIFEEVVDEINDTEQFVAALADGPEDALIVGLQLVGERIVSKFGGRHGHHSDPQWAGGAKKQKLTDMWQGGHEQLHNDMNVFLDEFGMRPQKGNSGQIIKAKFGRNGILDKVAAFYQKNSSK